MPNKYELILEELRRELAAANKPKNFVNYQRFFKEELKDPVGLKAPILRRISNQVYPTRMGLVEKVKGVVAAGLANPF